MNPLVIERVFPAPPETVFDFITERDNLMKWWGPEGVTISDETLDFTRKGAWQSVMVNSNGQRFKVSGQVTTVRKPDLLAFTWGWHDDNDTRGHESQVVIELSEAERGQTRFQLTHHDLADAESAANHEMGWTSSLRKLERMCA